MSSRLAARAAASSWSAFVEPETQVDDLLLEAVDPALERVDVGGGAEPGFPPGVLAEEAGQPAFELLDAGGEPGGSLLGVEQVGLQGGAARGGPGSGGSRRAVLAAWTCSSRSR